MSAQEEDREDDDPSNLTRAALIRMVRKFKAKQLKDREAEDMEEDDERAEEERKKLADMHEETKGKAPKIPVEPDDLPEEIGEYASDDEGDKSEKKSKRA